MQASLYRISRFSAKALHALLLLSILVCCIPASAQQQDLDSIYTRLKQHPQEDTIRVQILADLAYTYHTISPDSTTLIAKRAYEMANKLNYERGLADAHKLWAIGSYLIAEYNEAISHNEQALTIYRKLGEQKGAGAVLNNIAIIRHNQGDFRTALDYYNQSLEIRIAINDLRGIAACYNNIGNTYSDLGQYGDALFYIFRGLYIRERINDKHSIANSLSNIANIYFLLGKYNECLKYSLKAITMQEAIGNKDGMIQSCVAIGGAYHIQKQHQKALFYFRKALRLADEMGNKHSIALCLSNIGEEYVSQKRYAEAENYFTEALKLSEESGDQMSIAINHSGLGLVQLRTGRAKASIANLLTSYTIASEIQSRPRIQESAGYLAEAYEALNDLKSANFYMKKYVAYKDSIFNDEVTKKTQQIEFNSLLIKKQKEIAVLEKDRSIQQGVSDKNRFIIIGITTLLLITLIFTLSLFKSRQRLSKAHNEIKRQSDELQELNGIKDKVLSIMSHDLRSPVASLTGIVSLIDQDTMSRDDFKMLKNGMSRQLAAVSLLLENLLYWSRSQLQGEGVLHKETFDIHTIIEQNIILLHESASQKEISLTNETLPGMHLYAYADPNHVDIVIRNLISNAIKFTHQGGSIEVSATAGKDHVFISVTDNGIGMSEEVRRHVFEHFHQSSFGTDGEKGTGLGLMLCKDFIQQNNGTIGVTSTPGKGSTFYFTLPISTERQVL
jgi:signal transduction histidine kinase